MEGYLFVNLRRQARVYRGGGELVTLSEAKGL